MFARQPGVWCGPNIRCRTLPGPVEEIQAPPAEDGLWIDGLNTFVDKGDRQGFVHKENFDKVFNTTTTEKAAEAEGETNQESGGNGGNGGNNQQGQLGE